MLFSTLKFLSSFLLILEVMAQIPPPAETFLGHLSLPSYHRCIPPGQWFSSLAACWDHPGSFRKYQCLRLPTDILFNLVSHWGLGLS